MTDPTVLGSGAVPFWLAVLGLPPLLLLIYYLPRQFAASSDKTRVETLMSKMKNIYYQGRQRQTVTRSQADEFSRLADEAIGIINGRSDKKWVKLSFSEMLSARTEIQRMGIHVSSLSAGKSASEEVASLALLRHKGMISDHEFEAFSERFRLTSGEKASGIVQAISELHEEYEKGAMSEGNYHAGLWSLLDKLDRRT